MQWNELRTSNDVMEETIVHPSLDNLLHSHELTYIQGNKVNIVSIENIICQTKYYNPNF